MKPTPLSPRWNTSHYQNWCRPYGNNRAAHPMRICSLLPGATEVVAALGLADQLVGISHECDYPPGLSAPVVVEPVLRTEGLSSAEIDRLVGTASAEHQHLYRLSASLLADARPDLVIVQDMCDVCAITPAQFDRLVFELTPRPRLLKLHPRTLNDTFEDILRIGSAVEKETEARHMSDFLQQAAAAIAHRTGSAGTRPRVACLEWLSPLYIAGHWVPDMVDLAGGTAVLAQSGAASRRITWDELKTSLPDIIVIMPCGFTKERATGEFNQVVNQPEWKELPAIQRGQCHIVDALSYFSRPGPRLVNGIAQLATLLHPTLWPGPMNENWPSWAAGPNPVRP
jgi:iron complex transport system substrate-binding protein